MPEDKQVQGWFRQRVGTFTQMAIGFALLSIAFRHVMDTDYRFPTVNTLERRVAFALRCLAVSMVPLVVALGSVAFGRFFSAAINPFSGNEKLVEIPARILQNTLEQFILHSFMLLALSTLVTDETVKYVPFLCAVFVVARVLFIIGYRIHTSTRALGFFSTFLPTVVTLITILIHLYKQGITTFEEVTASRLNSQE